MRTVVATSLLHDGVRTPVEVVLTPPTEPITDTLEGQVGVPRACLLEAGAALLELAALMVEVVGVPDEPARTGDGDVVVNVAVHAKDVRILGFLRTAHVEFPFHHRVQVEFIGFPVVVDGTG